MSNTDSRLICLNDLDNIVVLATSVEDGETLCVNGKKIRVKNALSLGHKLARRDIPAGENILKYGLPIGFASQDISAGDHVHLHNLTSCYTSVEIME